MQGWTQTRVGLQVFLISLRFSIGIEHITDLLADLDRAFARVASK